MTKGRREAIGKLAIHAEQILNRPVWHGTPLSSRAPTLNLATPRLALVCVWTNVVITYIIDNNYERDKESARHPGGGGISGSAPYLRSALSRSCPVLEIRGPIADPIQCAPNPTRRACRTAVRRDCEPDDYPRP